MTIQVQEAFVANLLAIPGMNALIGTKVYPIQVPPGVSLPAIQYTSTDGYAITYYTGSFGLPEYPITLDVYSETYREGQQIVDLITNHYNGFSGALNSTVNAQRIVLNNVLNSLDTSSGSVYRTIIELTITI